MSIHASRPEPPKPAARAIIVDPPHAAAPPVPPPPREVEAEPLVTPPSVAGASVEASTAAEPRLAGRTNAAGAWYRREPWAAAMALAALCVTAALAAPRGAVYPLIGVGGACLFVGLALLVRGGMPPRGEL